MAKLLVWWGLEMLDFLWRKSGVPLEKTVPRLRLVLGRRSARGEDLGDFISVDWRVRSTAIAKKYFSAYQIGSGSNFIYRRDRFHCFPNDWYTKVRIVESLNRSIETINAAYPGLIPLRVPDEMTQDDINHLHTYFEKYRGPMLEPAWPYREASSEVIEAFDEMNLMIHRFEDMGFSGRGAGVGYPMIHINFGLDERVRRYDLADDDYQEFTFESDFGTWFVSYCEVGKPLHDIWRDGDQHIGSEVTLPLRYYSADGIVSFGPRAGPEHHVEMERRFYEWWDENREVIENLGFKKYDPKNSFGAIPVADLDRNCPALAGKTDSEIVDLLSQYQWLRSAEWA